MRRRELFAALAFTSIALGACHWDPSRPFDRNAPEVDHAIAALDAGEAGTATSMLEEYLVTGECKEGSIGTPPIVKKRPNGTFDLGLSLFKVAEAFGQRFGDEETDAGAGDEQKQARSAQIGCALAVVQAIAGDDSQPIDLRLHARYLEGNLHFLGGDYEEAVSAYDKALTISPGLVDAGDAVSRDAAWNRAIAQRRIEDKKDAGQDASKDGSQDGAGDGASPPDSSDNKDSGNDSGGDDKDSGQPDAGPDSGPDSGNDAASPPPQKDAGPPPPPPRANQDERILDQLENAPTVQQEDAKKRAGKHRVRGMADK